jgi:lactoylglutathione lyase
MYHNPKKQFSSYFIKFEGECSLELMHQPSRVHQNSKENLGLHHFAFSVGSPAKVDELTNILRSKGFEIFGEPRVTGDGFYESIVLDPDGNLVEITE